MLSSTSVAPNCRVSFTYDLISIQGSRAKPSTDYFTKLLEDDLKAVVKPQYVDQIPRAVRGPVKSVRGLIESRSTSNNLEEVYNTLGMLSNLNPLYDAVFPNK